MAPPPLDDAEIERRLAFATEVATIAGAKLLDLRRTNRWTDEVVLGDVADHLADAFLQGALRGRYPDDGVLSEETKDSRERLGKRCVWIVDPLDGTKEYRSGRHDWAVHVGLAIDGAPVLGAVAMPAIDRVLTGALGTKESKLAMVGATAGWPDELAALSGGHDPIRLATSRSHTPPWIERFGADLGSAGAGVHFVPSGSVGFKVGLLLADEADVYVHDKGLKEWDTLAPEVVARAGGWSVCRLDGTPHRYNQPDPRNDELVVCRPSLLPRVLAALASHAPRPQSG